MLDKRVLSAGITAVTAVLATGPVARAAQKRSSAKGRPSSVEKVSPKPRGSRSRAQPAAHGQRSRAPTRPAMTAARPRAAGTAPRAAPSGAGSDLQEAIPSVIKSPGFTIGVGVMYFAYTPPASEAPPAGLKVPALPEPQSSRAGCSRTTGRSDDGRTPAAFAAFTSAARRCPASRRSRARRTRTSDARRGSDAPGAVASAPGTSASSGGSPCA